MRAVVLSTRFRAGAVVVGLAVAWLVGGAPVWGGF